MNAVEEYKLAEIQCAFLYTDDTIFLHGIKCELIRANNILSLDITHCRCHKDELFHFTLLFINYYQFLYAKIYEINSFADCLIKRLGKRQIVALTKLFANAEMLQANGRLIFMIVLRTKIHFYFNRGLVDAINDAVQINCGMFLKKK